MAENDANTTQADVHADDQSQVDANRDESQADSTHTDTLTRAEAKKLRSEAANLRQRLKDAETKAQEAERKQKERDDADAKAKGEWEKVATEREKELETLRAQIAERDLNDLKRTVAAEEGLPADLAVRLSGEDEDALRKDAKALAKHLKAKDAATDAGERTKPGQKRPDKAEYANPARWGLRH